MRLHARLLFRHGGPATLLVFLAAAHAAAPQGPAVEGCPVFPSDNIWNTRVDRLSADSRSDAYIASIGAAAGLHPDFGAGLYNGDPIGIPFHVVPGSQPRVRVAFEYRDESDLAAYPIPPDARIERPHDSSSDRHVLVIDRDECVLWELFGSARQQDGSWRAASGAIFDLRSNSLRPDGWTSADAAGLPIFPGLVRFDEVAAGEIRHALRITAPKTRREAVWPARHAASRSNDPQLPPLGQRFRLKPGVDLSRFSPRAQVILRALKEYGAILADNGSPWFLSGVPDDRWGDNGIVAELKSIRGSDFEAVDGGALFVAHHSARAAQPK